MAIAFSSSDSEIIGRKVNLENKERNDNFTLSEMYEIEKCIQWTIENKFKKIALQFPDNMLQDSTEVALILEKQTDKEFYVLGDTSYASCCVDEIAAEHAQADAIIHFGHACLSPSKRIPVLYVYGKQFVDIDDAVSTVEKLIPDKRIHMILIYEVMYEYAVESITEKLSEYKNMVVSELQVPQQGVKSLSSPENVNKNQIIRCHRKISISNEAPIDDYTILYIGSREVTLMNFMLNFRNCSFFTYNPTKLAGQLETLNVNKHLQRRYYYIEKAKDANIIGILVGTLGVSNYLDIIRHLKELVKSAGRKCYTVVVGKLNPAKLANFSEIEVFVNVACVESSLVDSKEFFQPIITPFELEVALNQARNWTGDYVTDFSEIIPGASKYVPISSNNSENSDVSLITGKIRHTPSSCDSLPEESETAVVTRDDMSISNIHVQGAGELLGQRTWKGLEQKLGETSVSGIEQGQTGIASKYEDENN